MMTQNNPILLVDDDDTLLNSMRIVLAANGFTNVTTINDSSAAMLAIPPLQPMCILLDLLMPPPGGMKLLEHISQEHPHIPIIVLTGVDEKDVNMRCLLSGAFDFLTKPVSEDRLITSIRKAAELWALRKENGCLRDHFLETGLRKPEIFLPIITRNEKMLAIFSYIEAIAETTFPVLVCGETGTGKELVAGALHAASGVNGQFVAVNVSGLDDNLFADTLFGHSKGAFTGAEQARPGLIDTAAGGTIFLDEIGDLSQVSQVKLLRLIQEREYFRIGEDTPRKTDAKIIVATHHDLWALQRSGKFRKDLYYRLSAHKIEIPPLRNRPGDIHLLIDYFVKTISDGMKMPRPTVPKAIYDLLQLYSFPGNIRQLQSIIADAISRHKGKTLSIEAAKKHLATKDMASGESIKVEHLSPHDVKVSFPTQLPTLKEAARQLVDEAMRRANGNQSAAARLIGISQPALSKRLNSKNNKPTL